MSVFLGMVQRVNGWRSPFLQLGGDNQFNSLMKANYTYDSSVTVADRKFIDIPIWPFTLGYPMDVSKISIPPPPKGKPKHCQISQKLPSS